MKTVNKKQSQLHCKVLVLLLVGALLLNWQALFVSKAETPGGAGSGDPNDAPSYGLLSAVTFQDAGMNYLSGIALDGAGKVWTWGWNQHGQLGINKGYGINSSAADRLGYAGGMVRIPYFVDNNINVIQVSAGYHFNLALDDEGNVYAWGHNNNQQTGFTTNTTYPSGEGRIAPAKVQGLPKIVRVEANNGYLDENISIALDEDGSLWIWGSNGAGEHGQGTTTAAANTSGNMSYRATPHKVIFPENIEIVDFCAGGWTVAYGAYIHVLDSNGDRWSWGRNVNGTLGLGSTALSYSATPQKATPVSGMGKLVQISSSYRATIALDENGKLWQWGVIYGTGGSASSTTNYGAPVQVGIDPSEIASIEYTPIPQNITAGERTYYFIDQHGRPWAWGSGTYYGFGREGGYTNASSQYTGVAQQYPKVMGDGDTQTSDSSAKAPPAKTPSSRGNYGFNQLHPTIYDKKYQNNPAEDVWIDLAFQPIPKLSQIFAARSTYMLLDEDGNIYRWGLDGSGSIAWGWDYDAAYDTTGNAKDGLYDKYLYEVMYMRGAPRIDPLALSFSKPTIKIYKGVTVPGTDTVTVNLTLPASVSSPQMNIDFDCEVRGIKYVIIPADPANPDFQNHEPDRADFEAAYGNMSYEQGDLLPGGPITSQSIVTTITKTLEISDNCKIWVLVSDLAYTRETDTICVYTADNFYTPMDLYQKGVKKADPLDVLFDMEQGRVEKVYPTAFDLNQFGMNDSLYADTNSDVYGIPLHEDGTVIPDPYFGFDQVRITALDVAGYALSDIMPPGSTPQINPVIYTLDEGYALSNDTHTFFYVLELPQKNAYINGKTKPDNGLPGIPVSVNADDEIRYTIDLMNEPAAVPDPSYDVVFVVDWSGSMRENMMTGGTNIRAMDYARDMVYEMSDYIFANYPGSRISLMGLNCSYDRAFSPHFGNNQNDARYLNIQVDTPFADKSNYTTVLNNAFSQEPASNNDDVAQFLRAAICKLRGDSSTAFGGTGKLNPDNVDGNGPVCPVKYVTPRTDFSRTPVIVLLSDFQMMETNSNPVNGTPIQSYAVNYWSGPMKTQVGNFAAYYPDGILMTVRLDHSEQDTLNKYWSSYLGNPGFYAPVWDFASATYDSLMAAYLSPATSLNTPSGYASRGWNFTKVSHGTSYDSALAGFKANFTNNAPPPNGMSTVTDVLPAGLSAPANISHGGTYDPEARTITWDLSGYPIGEMTVDFTVAVEAPGSYDNTANVEYPDGSDEDTNTTWHRYIPPHPVKEEFYEYCADAPYKGIELQSDNTVSVNHGASYYRGAAPPATIDKSDINYTYYGVLVDGVFDGRPLSELPAQLIDSVETDGIVVTYLYTRTVWTVTEQFQEFVVSTELMAENEVGVDDNMPYNPAVGTPPLTIVKNSKTYVYYGYQIGGIFVEGVSPANPIDPVKSDGIIIFLYRTTYEITEMFKTSPTESGDPDLAAPKINGAAQPAAFPTIYSGDSFLPATPPEKLAYEGYYWEYTGYTLNGGGLNDAPTEVISISDDYVLVYLYEKRAPIAYSLHLRQVIINRENSTVELPYAGYFTLRNDGVIFNVTTESNKYGVEVPFRDMIISLSDLDLECEIRTIVPQYYELVGYSAASDSTTPHIPPGIPGINPFLIDFALTSEWWVTVYVQPLNSSPGNYIWRTCINDFGEIYQAMSG